MEQIAVFRAMTLWHQIWWTCTSVVIAGATYFIYIWIDQCIMLKSFSGPLALPLVGNCYQAEALYLLRYLSSLRRRYGKIFTFFAFTKPYLVICDPIVVRRILSDTKTFNKGLDYTNQFAVAFGEGLVTSNGDRHRKDRGHFGKLFVKTNIAKYMTMVNEKCQAAIVEMLNGGEDMQSAECDVIDWDYKGRAPLPPDHPDCSVNCEDPGDKGGKAYNIEHFFSLLALRVFMQFAINFNFGPEKERWLAKAVSDGSWAIGRMITLGLPMWNIFPAVGVVRSGRELLWTEMKKVVDARKESMAAGGSKDIDDCLTVMIEENFSEQEMNDHLVTLLSAGHDTTAYFSAYMCYLLSIHPECQTRLRAEMQQVMWGRTEVTCDDVTEMKYLMNVMQETLRLYSIIPCVSRACTQETHIKEANVTIPKGANMLIPMSIINRDPELWENPSKFDPERFEGSTGYFTSSKNGFFPFGYGARTCIGNVLAQMESAVFIVKLVTQFRLLEDPGFKPAIFAGISLTTSNGINVRLERIRNRNPVSASATATASA